MRRITKDNVISLPVDAQEFARPRKTLDFTPQNSGQAFGSRLAGEFLAALVGRSTPFSAQQMWAMARANQIPHVRIGRRIFFQRDALIAFVECGGTPRAKR